MKRLIERSLTKKFLSYMLMIGLVPLLFFELITVLNILHVVAIISILFFGIMVSKHVVQLRAKNKELHDSLEKLKTTQIQMLQQEKMAGIVQLASGVAHEINNPLGYVNSNCEVINKYILRYEKVLDVYDMLRKNEEIGQVIECKLGVDLDNVWKENKIDSSRKDMTEITGDTKEGLKRISDIVNGLKSFSCINRLEEKTLFNLNEGITTTLIVANNELKYNCNVELKQGEIPDIYVNGGQITQVILNLIINAVYAIEEQHKETKGLISIKTFSDSDNVYLCIADNGSGMTDEIKKHVFEPFFTTKPVGKGTGLGLGIAYDIIINKHGGKIEIESQLGSGTCFTISLPFSSKKQS